MTDQNHVFSWVPYPKFIGHQFFVLINRRFIGVVDESALNTTILHFLGLLLPPILRSCCFRKSLPLFFIYELHDRSYQNSELFYNFSIRSTWIWWEDLFFMVRIHNECLVPFSFFAWENLGAVRRWIWLSPITKICS